MPKKGSAGGIVAGVHEILVGELMEVWTRGYGRLREPIREELMMSSRKRWPASRVFEVGRKQPWLYDWWCWMKSGHLGPPFKNYSRWQQSMKPSNGPFWVQPCAFTGITCRWSVPGKEFSKGHRLGWLEAWGTEPQVLALSCSSQFRLVSRASPSWENRRKNHIGQWRPETLGQFILWSRNL